MALPCANTNPSPAYSGKTFHSPDVNSVLQSQSIFREAQAAFVHWKQFHIVPLDPTWSDSDSSTVSSSQKVCLDPEMAANQTLHHLLHVVLQTPIDGPLHQAFVDNHIFGILDLVSFYSKEDLANLTYWDQQGAPRQLPPHHAIQLEFLFEWICSILDTEWDDDYAFTVDEECELLSCNNYLDWLYTQQHPPPG